MGDEKRLSLTPFDPADYLTDNETVEEYMKETKRIAADAPPRKGFAAMSPERAREIRDMGRRAAIERGLTHRFTSEEAREAGSLGGYARRRFSAEEVREIRARVAGGERQARIAAAFGVTRGQVNAIILGRTYRDVEA